MTVGYIESIVCPSFIQWALKRPPPTRQPANPPSDAEDSKYLARRALRTLSTVPTRTYRTLLSGKHFIMPEYTEPLASK